MLARDNPFATHRVLQVRYRLAGETWEQLLARLRQMHYRAALVGPRGTGKTTLLEDLEPRLAALGFVPQSFHLYADQCRWNPAWTESFFAGLGPRDMILLDGAEQMPRLGWWRFRQRCCHAGGLIITSHRAGLLPTLITCRTSPELLRDILGLLLGPDGQIPNEMILRLYRRHHGNLREVLRELYDHWSSR
jgi:hypothetical protein